MSSRFHLTKVLLLLLVFLSFITIVVAECPDACPPVDIPDYTDNADFQTWDSPQQGAWLQEYYNPTDALSFYQGGGSIGDYPEVDANFFSDFTNYAENSESFDTFFSGSYDDANIRDNFVNNPVSGAQYLTERYGATYTIPTTGEGDDIVGTLADNFDFNPGEGEPEEEGYIPASLTNAGMEIFLGDYTDDSSITEIRAVGEGFEIVKMVDGVEQTITIGGDAATEREVSYSESGDITFTQDGVVRSFTLNEGDSGENVEFNFDDEGNFHITGPVETIRDGNRINNFRGTLTFHADGRITADNAEMITRDLYASGQFEIDGNRIFAWDHGDTEFGNINSGGRTVIIDLATGVGVTTQGQNMDDGTKVTITRDEISPNSVFFSGDESTGDDGSGAEVSSSVIEGLRARAAQLAAADQNLGGNAEVFIDQNDADGTVTVTARGKVDVGLYADSPTGGVAPDPEGPHFTGTDDSAAFDMQITGLGVIVNVRGKAQYTDDQFFQEGGGEGITTSHKSASLLISREQNTPQDVVFVDCLACDSGNEVVRVHKQVGIGTQTSARGVLSGEVHNLDLTITKTEDGLSYSNSLSSLGGIAQGAGEGSQVHVGRDMLIEVGCGPDQSCAFGIMQDTESGHVKASYETYDDGQEKVISHTPIDLGIRSEIGAEIIFVDEDTAQDIDTFVLLVEEGKFDELSSVEIEGVPGLREVMLVQTGIDIDLIDNEGYLSHVSSVIEENEKRDGHFDRVFELTGARVDENGIPLTSEDKEKLERSRRSYDSGYHSYTAGMINVARAERAAARALRASCVDGSECAISDAELKQIERETGQLISSLHQGRDAANTRAEVKQEIRDRSRSSQEVAMKSLVISQHEQLQERSERLALANSRIDEYQSTLEDLKQERERMLADDEDLAYAREFRKVVEQIDIYEGLVVTQSRELEQAQMQVDSSIQTMQQNIMAYSDDPEFAAELAMTAGFYGLGEQFLDQVESLTPEVASEVGSTARLAQIQTLLDEGNLAAASRIHQQLSSSDSEVDRRVAKVVDELVWVAVMEKSREEEVGGAQARLSEKEQEVYLENKDLFTRLGRSWLNPVTWYQTAAGIVEYIPGGEEGGTRLSVKETYGLLDSKAIEGLTQSRDISLHTHAALAELRKAGYSSHDAINVITSGQMGSAVDESGERIFSDEDLSIRYAVIEDRSPFLDILSTELSGGEVTDEQLARYEERQIREDISFHEGRTVFVEDRLESLGDRYAGTSSGQWALAEDQALDESAKGAVVSERTIQKYGDIALESVTIFDVIPVNAILGTTLRVGSAALKTSGLATKVKFLQYGSQVSEATQDGLRLAHAELGAARSSQNTGRIARATEDLAQIEQKAVREIDLVARSKLTGRAFHFSSDARMLSDDVASARSGLHRAIESGNQEGISIATKRLDEAEGAFQAYKTAGSRIGTGFGESFLGKKRGITTAERAAYDELRLARRAYHAENSNGIVGVSSSTATRLTQASSAAEKATLSARFADDVAQRIESFSTPTSGRAADETATVLSGPNQEVIERMRQLEERGAVLGADGDGYKYLVFPEDEIETVREIERALNGELSGVADAAYDSAKTRVALEAEDASSALQSAQRVKRSSIQPSSVLDEVPPSEIATPNIKSARKPVEPRVSESAARSLRVETREGIPTTDSLEDLIGIKKGLTAPQSQVLNERDDLVQLIEFGTATREQTAHVRALDYLLLHDTGLKEGSVYVGQDAMDAFVTSLLREGPKESIRRVFRLEDGSYGVVVHRADGSTQVGNIRFEGELDELLRTDIERSIDNILQGSSGSIDDIGDEIIEEVHLLSTEVDVSIGFSDTISTGVHDELRLRTRTGEKDGASILFDAAYEGSKTPGVTLTKIDDISSIDAPGSLSTTTNNLVADFVASEGKLSRDPLHTKLRSQPHTVQENIDAAVGNPPTLARKNARVDAQKVDEEFDQALNSIKQDRNLGAANGVPTTASDDIIFEEVVPASIADEIEIIGPVTPLPLVVDNIQAGGSIDDVVDRVVSEQRVPRSTRASKIGSDVYELDGRRYGRGVGGVWHSPDGGQVSRYSDEILELEAARLDVSVDLVEETFNEGIIDIFKNHGKKVDSSLVIDPSEYEKSVLSLVDIVEDGSILTKDNIRELVYHRGLSTGMTRDEVRQLMADFDMLYARSEKATFDVALFSEVLAQLDQSYTNVHLFRDGAVLGASDKFYGKLTGSPKDPKILYVSRDSTKFQSDKLRVIMRELDKESSSLLEFKQKFQIEFNHLMETDQAFKNIADEVFVYLTSEGLLEEGSKLRFVDTCCTGTINYFLEGVVRYYQPSIPVDTLLMQSQIDYLSAGLNGFNVEGLSKAVEFSGNIEELTGVPLFKYKPSGAKIGDEDFRIKNMWGVHADAVISYLDELVVLRQTRERALLSPTFVTKVPPKLDLPPATKVSDTLVGDGEVWRLDGEEFIAHPQTGWSKRGVSDAIAGCAVCDIPGDPPIADVVALESSQIGVSFAKGSDPPAGVVDRIDDAVKSQIRRAFVKDPQSTLDAVDIVVLDDLGLDVGRVNDVIPSTVDDVVPTTADDVPALAVDDVTSSLQRSSTRGDGTVELSGNFFRKDSIDFESAKAHLSIHHGGDVAGSQFNGRVFSNPDDVQEAILHKLPDEIAYDQHGRAELTIRLELPADEPAGFTGVMRTEEAQELFSSQISKKARSPGGIPGEKDGLAGSWYPEMVRDDTGKFVVKLNPDESVANPQFKFEPHANIIEVGKSDFERLSGTNEITIIIGKVDDTPVIHTIFPGKNAPAFPASIEKFGVDTLTDSMEGRFWDDNVFVQVVDDVVDSARVADDLLVSSVASKREEVSTFSGKVRETTQEPVEKLYSGVSENFGKGDNRMFFFSFGESTDVKNIKYYFDLDTQTYTKVIDKEPPQNIFQRIGRIFTSKTEDVPLSVAAEREGIFLKDILSAERERLAFHMDIGNEFTSKPVITNLKDSSLVNDEVLDIIKESYRIDPDGTRALISENALEQLGILEVDSLALALRNKGIEIGADSSRTSKAAIKLERPLEENPGDYFVYHNTYISQIEGIAEGGLDPRVETLGHSRIDIDPIYDSATEQNLPDRLKGRGYSRSESVFAHSQQGASGDLSGRAFGSGSVQLKVKVDPDEVLVVQARYYEPAVKNPGSRQEYSESVKSYWEKSVTLRELDEYYVLKVEKHIDDEGLLWGTSVDYILLEDKAQAANLGYDLPKIITDPEVLIPNGVGVDTIQIERYGEGITDAIGADSFTQAAKGNDVLATENRVVVQDAQVADNVPDISSSPRPTTVDDVVEDVRVADVSLYSGKVSVSSSTQPRSLDDILSSVKVKTKRSGKSTYTLEDGSKYVYSSVDDSYHVVVAKEPPKGILQRIGRIFTSKNEEVPLLEAAQRQGLSLDDIVLVESTRLHTPVTSLEDVSELQGDVVDVIREAYRAEPVKTVGKVRDSVLADLGIGVDEFDHALRSALESADAQAALLSQFSSHGITLERSVSGDFILPSNHEYVRGKFGVVLDESDEFKKVMYIDENDRIQVAEYLPGDSYFRGEVDQVSLQMDLRADIIRYQEDKGLKSYKEKSFTDIEKQMFPTKAPKNINSKKPIVALDDISHLERKVGFSDDVDDIGKNVIEFSDPITIDLEDGSELLLREFTVVDEGGNIKILKYPVEVKNVDGTSKTLLFTKQTTDGRTIFASNDIDTFMRQRFPQSLEDVAQLGKSIYLHEGNRKDVVGYLLREGFDQDSIRIFPGLEEKVGGYELWEVTNPVTGEVRYLFANFKGSSKRKHIEAALFQSGFDQSKIAIIDYNKDYKALYLKALEKSKPDSVLIGTSEKMSLDYAVASEKGIDTGDLTAGGTFYVTVNGQTQKVISTAHPNGELSKFFAEALVEYNQKHPIKVVFSGDSGSLGPMREQLANFNEGYVPPGKMIHKDNMFTPTTFITQEGRVIRVENSMSTTIKSRLETGRKIEGRDGGVEVVFDTTHGNAYSANQEDIGYLVREAERGSDAIDVEGSYIAQVMEDAVIEGLQVPETSYLFHASDEVATGAPIATEGHIYHAKKSKHDIILEHITGDRINNILITTKHPNPPKPKSVVTRIYEEYDLSDASIKSNIGTRYGELRSQGKSEEEILDLIISEFGLTAQIES